MMYAFVFPIRRSSFAIRRSSFVTIHKPPHPLMLVVLLMVLFVGAGDRADGNRIVLTRLGHGVHEDVFAERPL